MNPERGEALEAAFETAFNALGKSNLEAIYHPRFQYLAVFNGTQEIGTAADAVQAGQLFAKAIKEG
jgi:hypothetical protein